MGLSRSDEQGSEPFMFWLCLTRCEHALRERSTPRLKDVCKPSLKAEAIVLTERTNCHARAPFERFDGSEPCTLFVVFRDPLEGQSQDSSIGLCHSAQVLAAKAKVAAAQCFKLRGFKLRGFKRRGFKMFGWVSGWVSGWVNGGADVYETRKQRLRRGPQTWCTNHRQKQSGQRRALSGG
jgi:hypothetical protein